MKKRLIILASVLGLSNVALAAPVTLPSSAQPLPIYASLDADWLIFTSDDTSLGYRKIVYTSGKVKECVKKALEKEICGKEYTLQELIDFKKGKGYTALAVSPFVTYSGQEKGIVVYYKKSE
jgi:hypothetical protein